MDSLLKTSVSLQIVLAAEKHLAAELAAEGMAFK
jgi:hypothetical protein